jgi:hypothetical protein
MNRLLGITAAGLSLAVAGEAGAQNQAPAPGFKDVPMTHWAYQAVENLRLKGILRGYPDADYRGKRTITRYEMAAALERIMAQASANAPVGTPDRSGPPGKRGPQGPRGEPGPSGVPPVAVSEFRSTLEQMQRELTTIHQQLDAADQKAGRLTNEVHDLNKHASPIQTGK